jgi:hypothetical protein
VQHRKPLDKLGTKAKLVETFSEKRAICRSYAFSQYAIKDNPDLTVFGKNLNIQESSIIFPNISILQKLSLSDRGLIPMN